MNFALVNGFQRLAAKVAGATVYTNRYWIVDFEPQIVPSLVRSMRPKV